ncbi:MAG: hypothetical protein B7Y45_02420 [Sphingomonas sp. 28-66-16]|nr:MAG: hypothetical protein B7Y45_02420 [Sphingomonas sp. 28-66-16]
MLNGVILLWYMLTALAVGFVAIDIRSSPVSPVMRWAFVLFTAYTGPIGVFLYVLGCREPLPDRHADYVQARWRQVLGSTMHCIAGDGVGILAGAVIGSVMSLDRPLEVALEYGLGFGFGWTIFQSLFMRSMAGGSYRVALKRAFIPEFLSMNLVMAGMTPVATVFWAAVGGKQSPLTPTFWFAMSMALLAGFVVAYPINWWLVAKGLKHGMSTASDHAPNYGSGKATAVQSSPMAHPGASTTEIALMAAISIIAFGCAYAIASVVQANMEMPSIALPSR